MSKKVKAKLTIYIDYELDKDSEAEIKQTLNKAVAYLVSSGFLTGNLDATIENWESSIETKPTED